MRVSFLLGMQWFIAVVVAHAAAESFPGRPVKVVVPFAAGGGSDTFVRILVKAIHEADLSPEPFTVINVPGAGGTIGSRRVRHAPADGYTLMNLHDGIITAKYSGTVPYGPEAFDPILGTGRVSLVITVSEESGINDLAALLEQMSAQPESIRFAANLGAPSHFAGLLLESHTAAKDGRFRFVTYGGGAKRFGALMGGHADVTVFSVAEFLAFRDGGLRALAIASRERSVRIPEVPSTEELGVPFRFDNTQFWWVPRGTAPERKRTLANILRSAMEHSEVKERLAAMQVEPVILEGVELEEALREKEEAIAALAIRRPLKIPGLEWGLLVVFAFLVVWQGMHSLRTKGSGPPREMIESSLDWGRAFGASTLFLIYLVLLGFEQVSFQWLTGGFLFGRGLLLTEKGHRPVVGLVAFSILMSLGVSWVFGTVLKIDLP